MQPWLVLTTLLFAFASAEKLPSSYKLCNRKDPNISVCLKEAIEDAFQLMKDGIPKLRIAAIDPLYVTSVTIAQGTNAVHVVQKYKNVNIHNLRTAKVEKVEAHVEEPFSIKMTIAVPECSLTADYDFNGKLLLLPIVGVGKCNVTLENMKADIEIMGEKVVKKGLTYIQAKRFTVNMKPQRVYYQFDNLFNGDQKLGFEMNRVMNENWKEVYEDVKIGYEELVESIGKHIFNGIFMKVPYQDIFLEK